MISVHVCKNASHYRSWTIPGFIPGSGIIDLIPG